MTHLDAVLKRLLFLKDSIIRTELLEVEFNFTIERHGLIFDLLVLILCISLEARSYELKSE